MLRGVFFVLISIFGVAVAVAQTGPDKGDLRIEVKDSNGALIPGAALTISTGENVIRTVATGPDGAAEVRALPIGTYTIKAAANGFTGAAVDFELKVAAVNVATLTLATGGISETVTATAERRQISAEDTAVPVSVIDREGIERQAPNTVGDLFRTLPGTSTVNEGGFQVRPRIRGLDSNRVLILVDGERLNNSRTSTEQSGIETGIVDTSQVEAVEVTRGSGSVLYGTDALGGTINIITRDTPTRRDAGFRFGATFDTFYSSNETGRRGNAAVNGSGKYFAFRVAQSLERFNNYFTGKPNSQFLADLTALGATVGADGEVANSQSHSSDTNVTGRFFINDRNSLKFNYDRRRAGNIGSAGLLEGFNAFFPYSNRDKFSARFDSAALTKHLQRLSASTFYQKQPRNFTNIINVPGFYQFSSTDTDTRTSGYDVQTDWFFGSRYDLIAGTSFFRDTNKDQRVTRIGADPATIFFTSNTKSVPNADLTNFAGFAQNEFRATSKLRFTGGLRVDKFNTKADPTTGFALPNLRPDQIADLGIGNLATGLNVSNTAVTGDIGAVYKLSQFVSLSGHVGRSFRTPNIFELFFTDNGSVGGFVVGNPGLKPEIGVNFDTSVKFKTSKVVGSVTYFNNNYRDLLATVPTDDSRGCPIFIVRPGTVYDANNCQIVSSPPGPAPVRVYQTQNIDKARIQGVEGEMEATFKISLGYLTPYGNVSYLRGDDTQTHLPLNFISPLRANVGFRWNNFGKSYFFDYYSRMVKEQSRLAPSFLLPVNQGGNGGPEPGFVTHNISGGYYFRREKYNFSINAGISNLFNKAYSEQFVFAPARGRSFTIGTTWTIK